MEDISVSLRDNALKNAAASISLLGSDTIGKNICRIGGRDTKDTGGSKT